MRLAERLIQQQDAAVSSASALRANIPDEGRVLTFKRAVVVDKQADLRIGLEAAAVQAVSGFARVKLLLGTLTILTVLMVLAKSLVSRPEDARA